MNQTQVFVPHWTPSPLKQDATLTTVTLHFLEEFLENICCREMMLRNYLCPFWGFRSPCTTKEHMRSVSNRRGRGEFQQSCAKVAVEGRHCVPADDWTISLRTEAVSDEMHSRLSVGQPFSWCCQNNVPHNTVMRRNIYICRIIPYSCQQQLHSGEREDFR